MKHHSYLRLCLSVMLALCFLLLPAAQAQEVPELLEPVSVKLDTYTVCRDDLSLLSMYDASVVPYVEELDFPQEGLVKDVHVVIGQQVKAGDLLMTLNQDAALDQIEQLNHDIESLEIKASYTEQLVALDLEILAVELRALQSQLTPDEKAIELKKLDIEEKKLTAEMDAALQALQLSEMRSKLEALQIQVEQNAMYAPFDGRVIHMAALTKGSYVNAYTPLIFLADDSRLLLRSAFISGSVLSTAHSMYARVGSHQYEITADEIDAKQYAALVLSGETPTTDFYIANPDENITSGAYAAIFIERKRLENVLQVPNNALYNGLSGRYLYVLENGVRVRRDVQTGLTNDIMTEIKSGLEEGEIVHVKE